MNLKKILFIIVIFISFFILLSNMCGDSYYNSISHHFIFNENAFLFTLTIYYYNLQDDIKNDFSSFNYNRKLTEFTQYLFNKYKIEIEKINKIYFDNEYKTYLKYKNTEKNYRYNIISLIEDKYLYYFSDFTQSNSVYFLLNYNFAGINYNLKQILNIFDTIKKDQKYKEIVGYILEDTQEHIKKIYDDLNKFLNKKYSRDLNFGSSTNNLNMIYYNIFETVLFSYQYSYPSGSWIDYRYNSDRIWINNIYSDYVDIVALMHLFFRQEFKNKNELKKYIEKYNNFKVINNLFDLNINDGFEIIKTNIYESFYDTLLLFDSFIFYNELFSNTFLLYYLKENGFDYFKYNTDIYIFISYNLSYTELYSQYLINFFKKYKGWHPVKNFIKYYYHMKKENITEAVKNTNRSIKNIIYDIEKNNENNVNNTNNTNSVNDTNNTNNENNTNTFYILNTLIKMDNEDTKLSFVDNDLIKIQLNKAGFKFKNILYSTPYNKTMFSIDLNKIYENYFTTREKILIISYLNYPFFISSLTKPIFNKLLTTENFLKLEKLYMDKNTSKLDYAILSYHDNIIFIYLHDLQQLGDIINKLKEIDSDHYFKYR